MDVKTQEEVESTVKLWMLIGCQTQVEAELTINMVLKYRRLKCLILIQKHQYRLLINILAIHQTFVHHQQFICQLNFFQTVNFLKRNTFQF